MTKTLRRAGAVWVDEDGKAYMWDDTTELFYAISRNDAYVPIDRRCDDEVLTECLS